MPYSYSTFLQAKQQLSQRLSDPDNQFWTDTEVGLYIIEALRTWNSLTSFFRSEFIVDTIADQVWYDLTSLSDCPNTLRPYTVTDTDLYTQMQNHLLEPPTGGTWTGSLQFSIDDLQNAVQRRRNEIISNTSCTISRHLIAANPGRTYLPDTVIDVIRVTWLPVSSPSGYEAVPLMEDDEFSLESYEGDFTVAAQGEPSTYRMSTEPPLAFDVNIPPAVPGYYEVLSIDAGPALSAPTASYLYVPDDYTWVVKFGAMADLLNRESVSKDELRAKYCNLRYMQGLMLLRSASAVLVARVANIPMDVEAVHQMDLYRPEWQAQNGTPDTLVIAGMNMVGVSPIPNFGPNSLTLGVVQNAPIPVVNADSIQVGQDEYDGVLDYSQHLASLKMGGAEFLSTMPLLQRFFKQASIYNSKLGEMGEYQKVMYELSQLQSQFSPTFEVSDVTDNAGVSSN